MAERPRSLSFPTAPPAVPPYLPVGLALLAGLLLQAGALALRVFG